jgi:drug/metabolite transporter (DMT)-like permease
VFAALIAMVFFHERFGRVRTAGAVLAVVGVLLLNR